MNHEPEKKRTGTNGTLDNQGTATRGVRHWIRNLFSVRDGTETLRDTIEELIESEEITDDSGADELVLLRNILNLRDLTTDDVMVPREIGRAHV